MKFYQFLISFCVVNKCASDFFKTPGKCPNHTFLTKDLNEINFKKVRYTQCNVSYIIWRKINVSLVFFKKPLNFPIFLTKIELESAEITLTLNSP